MIDPESKQVWNEIKEIWKSSSETKRIHIQLSKLVEELEGKVSQFEKDSIRKDIAIITSSTTQFEKDSISRDIAWISRLIKKLLRRLGITK